ncbi:hypothetical protein SAMN02927923_01845 [Microvirga guangxiensis]|uniref:Uncharacterized protein n=1 Tax=Microvirga guangxiensis TaxID=549386 RepID=A0A1G5HQ67_9HYPH|nr:hypothetical protein SAMN02927923_01845 [Microvirga guangxiensis]
MAGSGGAGVKAPEAPGTTVSVVEASGLRRLSAVGELRSPNGLPGSSKIRGWLCMKPPLPPHACYTQALPSCLPAGSPSVSCPGLRRLLF